MPKYISGVIIGLTIGLSVAAATAATSATPEQAESPSAYEITEDLRVVRVFDADTGEWITEIWPARCTVFEDGSADCPSYFD